jgi:hypothetical protein
MTFYYKFEVNNVIVDVQRLLFFLLLFFLFFIFSFALFFLFLLILSEICNFLHCHDFIQSHANLLANFVGLSDPFLHSLLISVNFLHILSFTV